ncbi:hypothetical protein [Yoonia sediminilitoris]|uniref:FAR-17a/AIG1-like protein n=1 Tax=Yoonia sediminilitoris TaxID=1286148 RepID=A0A2T6KLC7_9RHOB|nr:hypothetical protein [Yoonia sediminilitoris]PUB17013.1 FAR-17a/AIG1-like protein [Yoonia sediminilitoris]RCW97308.1 FAR-17a/AIG1-like protein [Yoonia sediminilitoris]
MTAVPIYRWIVFLLAGGYCLRTLFFGDWNDNIGGPFRFLTIWALFMSFFAASRMMALQEGRSLRRWDGFVSMTAVINTMVVFLYWRLFLADPSSVTRDGMLAAWWLELYLHGLGPLLQIIDALFIHRSFRRIMPAIGWVLGVILVYVAWAELVVQPSNTGPAGTVTSGLPYPFLNDLELVPRMIFYGTNMATGLVLLLVFATISWAIRRRLPVPAVP